MGWLLSVTVGTTAVESLNAAGNIFLGQTEAPLLIRPFIKDLTKYDILRLHTPEVHMGPKFTTRPLNISILHSCL